MLKYLRLSIFTIVCILCARGIQAQCTPDSTLFSYTGGAQTFTVPGCVNSITIKAWGAGGGGGGIDCDHGGAGGGGAYTSSVITVTQNEILTIVIGGGGSPGANNAAGTGGGANGYGYGGGGIGGTPGYQHPGGVSGAGGGGGGGTAVLQNPSTPLLVAGGGGGGGGAGCSTGGGVGGGGGQNGFNGSGSGGAAGGSSDSVGVIGSSGEWDCGGGGGGGGGWNAGDSGEVYDQCDCGAGGGGGGNCLGTLVLDGNGANPGYSAYPELPAGYADGGPPDAGTGGQKGGNGYMIIEYCFSSGGVGATAAFTAPLCYGYDNGTATANPSGGHSPYTYLWEPGAQTNQTATGLSAGTYTILLTDSSGCSNSTTVTLTQPAAVNVSATSVPPDSACAGQTITLNASGATTYVWSNGATGSSISVVIPAGDTASYGVKGTTNGCNDSTFIKIKVIPTIAATALALQTTICPFSIDTLVALGTGGQVTYTWSTGATTSSIRVAPSVTTTYTASVHGICNTVNIPVTVNVTPLDPPIISGDTAQCKGEKVTLTVSGGTSYLWSDGSTKTSYTTGAINADSTITVIAYNSLGCPDTAQYKISIAPKPGIAITHTNNCLNNPIVIKANTTGNGPFTYLWTPGGGTTDSIIVPDTTRTYTVTVSNGCSNSQTINITPYIPPISACCDKVILLGDDTTIVAYGDSIKTYTWSPSVTCLNPVCDTVKVAPAVTTTYTVTGTDSMGCTVERLVTIIVDAPCLNFTVPNVITPNDAGPSGLNSLLYIKTENITNWSLNIYDRWGKEMYTSTNPTQYWTGTTESGAQASDGVYYYIITATCQNASYKRDGFVQLIR